MQRLIALLLITIRAHPRMLILRGVGLLEVVFALTAGVDLMGG